MHLGDSSFKVSHSSTYLAPSPTGWPEKEEGAKREMGDGSWANPSPSRGRGSKSIKTSQNWAEGGRKEKRPPSGASSLAPRPKVEWGTSSHQCLHLWFPRRDSWLCRRCRGASLAAPRGYGWVARHEEMWSLPQSQKILGDGMILFKPFFFFLIF